MDKPVTEKDFRYMSIPAVLATEKRKVQSAKRLLKQKRYSICLTCGSSLSFRVKICPICWSKDIVDVVDYSEIDACFQIDDGKE